MGYSKIQFLIIAMVFIIDVLWINFSSIPFVYSTKKILFISFISIFLFIYKKIRAEPKIVMICDFSIILLNFSFYAMILSYLFYTLNLPTIDQTLAAMDEALGFYAPSFVRWIRAHSWLDHFFYFIYQLLLFEIAFILLYFAFYRKTGNLQKFLMQYMIAGLITVMVGGLLPAYGVCEWYAIVPDGFQKSMTSHIYQLRNSILDISTEDGLVSFPSFHTTLALLISYAFYYEKTALFRGFLLLNTMVIFSCLSTGAHYLVDLLGGIILFFMTIKINQWIERYIRPIANKKSFL